MAAVNITGRKMSSQAKVEGLLLRYNDNGGQNNYSFEEDIDEDPVNPCEGDRILHHDKMYNILLQDYWKENNEVGDAPVAEQRYRAVDGCLRNGEVQVDICLDSERANITPILLYIVAKAQWKKTISSAVWSRDNCETRSTFAFAAATTYCEDQGTYATLLRC
eukprot:scaffold24737_cov80-Skeletonema_marinoi.AAC.1